jgi:ubiquinol-cytochrome c reductase iron-sulfur subunit
MSNNNNKDKSTRRDFLTTVTATVGAVGVGAAVLPIISQMNPDSSVKALASIEVDISNIQEGKEITVLWRGKPVFIKRRTKEEIQKAEQTSMKDLYLRKN